MLIESWEKCSAVQSNENVNLEDGIQVHLVHVGMSHGGDAVRN